MEIFENRVFMEVKLKEPIDNLCDYTYNFAWQDNKIHPTDIIPSQEDTSFTYKELVNELKKGKDVRIYGNVGKRLAYSLRANLCISGEMERLKKLERYISMEM